MNKLQELWSKGTDFLGTKYSIMGGAMSWVSESNLVSAISNSGAFGVLASGAMEPQMLTTVIKDTQTKTTNNFGVNIITLHPKIDELIKVCIDEQVSHVVLAGGLPNAKMIQPLKEAGVKVLAFAPTITIAKRLLKLGVDALIVEGSEAGGHVGPVSLTILVQEILIPLKDDSLIFVAGGICKGETMASYLEMGACGVQMGTPFVCTEESIAHPNFKNVFLNSSSRDAQVTIQVDKNFPVIPVRAIKNKATDDFVDVQRAVIKDFQEGKITKEQGQIRVEHYWAGALRKAVIDGDIIDGSLMAGQSVGMVNTIKPVNELIEGIIFEAKEYLKNR